MPATKECIGRDSGAPAAPIGPRHRTARAYIAPDIAAREAPAPAPGAPGARPRPRDPRLDFFRGIAMAVILMSHTPGNPWALWIPSRFGFSDAAEIFVFCSGMASALAFGKVFDTHGWGMGAARIAHRVWQVYWAHIGTFFVIAMLMVALNQWQVTGRDHVGWLNLWPFFHDAGRELLGLFTLTYVPNYFDILPMYMVLLAMVPPVMALSRLSVPAVLAGLLLLWAATNAAPWAEAGAPLDGLADGTGWLHLPAQYWFAPPHDTREWFFDPFGWQLVFFTGFAFMRGWLPAPPVRVWLLCLAGAVVLLSIPVAWYRVADAVPAVAEWRDSWQVLYAKTTSGPLRLVHFLAMAYLAWAAVGPQGARLVGRGAWPAAVAVVRKVGEQSLAVFVTSMVLARLSGVALELWGRDPLIAAAVNLGGVAILVGTAYMVAWFKGQPWRRRPQPRAAQDATPATEGQPA